MATRLYFQTVEPATVSPAFSSLWDYTGQADRLKMARNQRFTAFANKAITFTATVAKEDHCIRQYVSDPLATAVTFPNATRIRTSLRKLRSTHPAGTVFINNQFSLRIVSADGATTRGIIRDVDVVSTWSVSDWATAGLESRFTNLVGNGGVVNAFQGDRIVLEVGLQTNVSAPRTPTCTIEFGDAATSDLPLSNGDTNQYNGWLEFTDLNFALEESPVLPPVVTTPLEQISKLQPNRTVHLRGFDDRGAAAALHSTTATGFTVTGVFRDMADFCVLMLWDADNFFEHPRIKYLPDFSFAGSVLQFDVRYTGLMPLDSAKFPTVDWPYLDYVRQNGATGQVRLFDYATAVSGSWTAASGVYTFTGPTARLWYQNSAYEAASAAALAAQITGDLTAVAVGDTITIAAARAGADGNRIRLRCDGGISGPDRLSGGSSDVTWRVRLDFSALGLTALRQMWLTFAPLLPDGGLYSATEWTAVFTNWSATGSPLKVAGAGSVRVEEDDRWCTYSGSSWASETGFYSKGFARRCTTPGHGVRVRYACQYTHDVYIGTSLAVGRGAFSVSLDGDAATLLDTALATDSAVITRRLVRSSVAAGEHEVLLVNEGGGPTYFDFLEAAVLSDIPAAPAARTDVCPATDYGTDHGYKLSPARLLWMLDTLGFAGPLNLYVSVFWWNQRARSGGVIPSATVTFAGAFRGLEAYLVSPSPPTYANYQADQIFLTLGALSLGKTVFTGDTPESIAQHFADYINGVSVAAWAQAVGPVLTIYSQAAGSAYEFPLSVRVETDATRAGAYISTGTATASAAALSGSVAPTWVIDPAVSPVINVATRAWLADLLTLATAAGREVTLALSMELLNPPAGWASLFPDGTPVTTATGFGANFTTHCAFVPPVLAYHQLAYRELAALMATAGTSGALQFGEFLWWFFANASGMALYHPTDTAAFLAAQGRALYRFLTPNDDPSVNAGVDVAFLQERLVAYMVGIRSFVRATYPAAQFELLLPLDVNYPEVYGRYSLGGRLNYALNIPPAFRSPDTAPFDRIKMEGLDFGSGSRDIDKARRCMRFPTAEMNWPANRVSYLIADFNGGCPWARETLIAREEQIQALGLWAFDHVCLLGWPIEEPEARDGSGIL